MGTNGTRIVEPKLSYKLMSVLFLVHNTLGNGNQEKHYQKAIAIELEKQKIKFIREQYAPILYGGENIGKYYLDFVIEGKVILETKTVPFMTQQYYNQIYGYMKHLKIQLGILANFRPPRLEYKRLILSDKYLKENSI